MVDERTGRRGWGQRAGSPSHACCGTASSSAIRTPGPRYFYLLIVVVAHDHALLPVSTCRAPWLPRSRRSCTCPFPFFVYIVVISKRARRLRLAVRGAGRPLGAGPTSSPTALVFSRAPMIAFGVPQLPQQVRLSHHVSPRSASSRASCWWPRRPSCARLLPPGRPGLGPWGFWTLGRSSGGLIVAEVSSRTVNHFHFWYSGAQGAGLNNVRMAGPVRPSAGSSGWWWPPIAVLFLKELFPQSPRPADGVHGGTARWSKPGQRAWISGKPSVIPGARCCTSTSWDRPPPSASS